MPHKIVDNTKLRFATQGSGSMTHRSHRRRSENVDNTISEIVNNIKFHSPVHTVLLAVSEDATDSPEDQ